MIISYKHQGAKDIFNGDDTKYARRACPQNLWKIARRKLDQLDFAASLNDLRSPPKNRLEALKGDKPTAWLRYAKDNTVSVLTTSTEFALSGHMTALSMLRLQIIIKKRGLWLISQLIDHRLAQARC